MFSQAENRQHMFLQPLTNTLAARKARPGMPRPRHKLKAPSVRLRSLSAVPAAFWVFFAGAATAQSQLETTAPTHVVALRTEARAYEHGEGVTKNARRAVELYC